MESRQEASFGRKLRRSWGTIAIPLALVVISVAPNAGQANDTTYGADGESSENPSFAREAPQMAPVPYQGGNYPPFQYHHIRCRWLQLQSNGTTCVWNAIAS